jgi:hypothetical protein
MGVSIHPWPSVAIRFRLGYIRGDCVASMVLKALEVEDGEARMISMTIIFYQIVIPIISGWWF